MTSPNEKNFGLKHFIQTYPYRGYPSDVSENGRRFMIPLYMKKGSSVKDFKSLAKRTGLENALSGEPDFDMCTDYRPRNQVHARAGDIFQVFAKRFQDTIEVTIYGLMEDILSFIDSTKEGELVSQPELYLGPLAYHLFRGKALWETGHYLDQAIAEYEQGLKSNPLKTTNHAIKKSFDDMVADLHYNLGLVFSEKGVSQRAIEEFETYLKHDSTTRWAEQARRHIDKLSNE